MGDIKRFEGEFYFLSNFCPFPMEYEGLHFLSSEAAYQAAKTEDMELRKKFCHLSAKDAKKLGRQIPLRSGWDEMKVSVMRAIIKLKFAPGSKMAVLLLATEDAYLEESNWWGGGHLLRNPQGYRGELAGPHPDGAAGLSQSEGSPQWMNPSSSGSCLPGSPWRFPSSSPRPAKAGRFRRP